MSRNFHNQIKISCYFCILIQVGVYSTTLNEEEKNCVDKFELNRETIEAWNIEPLLPEDNDEINKYMSCYWKRLGYLEENGDLNYVKISEVVHSDLKTRLNNSECMHIALYVVNSCRKSVEAESDGVRAIRMWNCLNLQTENLF